MKPLDEHEQVDQRYQGEGDIVHLRYAFSVRMLVTSASWRPEAYPTAEMPTSHAWQNMG